MKIYKATHTGPCTYQIELKGFDPETTETDDKIKWINEISLDTAKAFAIRRWGEENIVEIMEIWRRENDDGVDFTLPSKRFFK